MRISASQSFCASARSPDRSNVWQSTVARPSSRLGLDRKSKCRRRTRRTTSTVATSSLEPKCASASGQRRLANSARSVLEEWDPSSGPPRSANRLTIRAGSVASASRRRACQPSSGSFASSPVTNTKRSRFLWNVGVSVWNHCSHAASTKVAGNPAPVTCRWLLIDTSAVCSPSPPSNVTARSSSNRPLSRVCQSM